MFNKYKKFKIRLLTMKKKLMIKMKKNNNINKYKVNKK